MYRKRKRRETPGIRGATAPAPLRFDPPVATQQAVETRRPGWLGIVGCVLTGSLLVGCSVPVRVPAARPLPEVRFIPPDDPQAVVALSAEDEMQLVERDRLLRERIRMLEGMLAEK